MQKYLFIILYIILGIQIVIPQEMNTNDTPKLEIIYDKDKNKIITKYVNKDSGVLGLEYHENLHALFVSEAYNLLEYENGSSVTDMDYFLPYIQGGAIFEDMNDPVYHISFPTPTLTHFWNADLGDSHQWNFLLTDYPNAYQKSIKYYYLDCDAEKVSVIDGGIQTDYYFTFFNATNLIDCYNNYEIYVVGKGTYATEGFITPIIPAQPILTYFDQDDANAMRSILTYIVIGRLCHLIADMAVPAHTHNDPHWGFLGFDGDIWEESIGQSLHGANYLSALNQGGILSDIEYKNVPIRYLLYTMNQIGDYYPSFSGPLSPDANGDRNYNNWYSYDTYTHLDDFFTSSYGSQSVITNIGSFYGRWAEMQIVLLNWAIRTQASLLYWYGIETEQVVPQKPNLGMPYGGYQSCSDTISFHCSGHENPNFKYDFQFATDNNFTNIFKEFYNRVGLSGITVSGFEKGQTYYWRARASNNAGYSNWSNISSFSIKPELTVSISGPDWLKYKQRETYTANVSGGSGNYTYQWYKNGWQPYGTNQSTSVSMYNEDVTLSVIATDGCQSGQASKTIYYGMAPKTSNLTSTIPTEFNLYNPFPNPFNPVTTINFDLPKESFVNITVFNISGQKVQVLTNKDYTAGRYKIKFEGLNLPSGVYIYKMNAGEYSNIKRMLLIK